MVSPIAKNNIVCLYGFWITRFRNNLQFYIETGISFFFLTLFPIRQQICIHIFLEVLDAPFFLHRWWMGWDGYIWVGWGTETLNIANETVNFGFDFKWWRFLLEWCFCLVYPTLQIVWRIRENVGTTKLHPVLNQAPPTQIKLIQKNWNRMKYCVLFCEGTYCWSYA